MSTLASAPSLDVFSAAEGIPVQGGGYNCETSCPDWILIGFCLHTVAVADANKKLTLFLTFLQNKKKASNITNLIPSGIP